MEFLVGVRHVVPVFARTLDASCFFLSTDSQKQSGEFQARMELSGLPPYLPEVVCAPVAQLDRAPFFFLNY